MRCLLAGEVESCGSLKSEIRHVLHENELLRTQLHLVRENAGLRIGSLLATIISWFEEKEKGGGNSESLLLLVALHQVIISDNSTADIFGDYRTTIQYNTIQSNLFQLSYISIIIIIHCIFLNEKSKRICRKLNKLLETHPELHIFNLHKS